MWWVRSSWHEDGAVEVSSWANSCNQDGRAWVKHFVAGPEKQKPQCFHTGVWIRWWPRAESIGLQDVDHPVSQESINFVMIAHVDWNDFMIRDDELQGDPIFQVDGHAVQAFQPALQAMKP